MALRELRDVVVVGAGPAGSAAAIFLRQRGRDVLLLDEARFPRDKICGESVSPGARPLLAALGVADAVCRLGPHPLRGMALTSPDGTSFRGDYRDVAEPGFATRRDAFDHVLLDGARAAGAEVREGVRATGLVFANGDGTGSADGMVVGVTCEDGSGPETLRARLVIGADGRRSVVARRLGLLREHRSLCKFAVRGHWEGMDGLEERGEMHVGGGGYCGIAPLAPRRANVTFVLDRAEMAAAGGDLESFYRETLRRWPRIEERLARASLLGPPRAIGPLALEASRVSAPGALLVGDSAGFYDPFTGEGVTLALRSAEMAADVADRALQSLGTTRRASRPSGADLLAYDRARHASTRDKFRINWMLQRVVARPALSNAMARRLSYRPDLADKLVGIAGDFVPARSAWSWRFLWELVAG
ncbi:MAG TPA: NAD(P)/FAD-dependent oxidoreductase [Vicinamibacteria bacterium]|jgi:geranylgeranyl reductase family protein